MSYTRPRYSFSDFYLVDVGEPRIPISSKIPVAFPSSRPKSRPTPAYVDSVEIQAGSVETQLPHSRRSCRVSFNAAEIPVMNSLCGFGRYPPTPFRRCRMSRTASELGRLSRERHRMERRTSAYCPREEDSSRASRHTRPQSPFRIVRRPLCKAAWATFYNDPVRVFAIRGRMV